jgi:hypothetical protein
MRGKAAIVPALKLTPLLAVIATAVPSMSTLASALADGIYKCKGSGSAPVYQQQPCPAGTTLRDLVQDPATVSVIPFEGAAPAPAVKPSRTSKRAPAPRTARPEKVDKRKAEAERRSSEAAVVERRHVKDGMSDGEVLARLGPPDLQSGKGGRKMRWTYMPVPGDAQTVTQVHFVDGRVVAVDRTTMR